jgi:heat shock protein HslJ
VKAVNARRFLGMLVAWAALAPVLAGGAEMTALQGATWRLASVAHADGETRAVPDSVEATATFADGAVSGSGGCNRYTAGYTIDGGNLTIAVGATTMMACPDPQTAVEGPFLAALGVTAAYRIESGRLTLLNARGEAVATFIVQKPEALTGVTWRTTVYNNGRGGAVSLIDGSQMTASFGGDGQLKGSAGCNHYRAAYVTEGSSITIRTPATTRMTCTHPDGVMRQEREYLHALATAATYAIQGKQLELRTAEGALAALFRAGGD